MEPLQNKLSPVGLLKYLFVKPVKAIFREPFRPEPDKMCIFKFDPIVLFVNKYNIHWIVVTCSLILILTTPRVILCAFNDCLISSEMRSDFQGDLAHFPPFVLVMQTASSTAGLIGFDAGVGRLRDGAVDRATSTNLPLLRDYADMFFIVIFRSSGR